MKQYTNREITDGKLHDAMIDSYAFTLLTAFNKGGKSLEVMVETNYWNNTKHNTFSLDFRHKWNPHEADITAYCKELDTAYVVEVKTTDYLSGRKKAKSQLGYDEEFAKWLYKTNNVRKIYVYDKHKGEEQTDKYHIEVLK